MIKLSKSTWWVIGIVLVLGVVGYIYTEPTEPTAVRYVRPNSASQAAPLPSDILPEDLTAHFDRYMGGKRDPFVPASLRTQPDDLFDSSGSIGGKGTWKLTGVNVVNGEVSALVENATTGESVFLSKGDQWRGLRVVSIVSDAVVFENALGQQTRLAFDLPTNDVVEPENTANGGASLPPLGAIPPMPIGGNIHPLPNFTPQGAPQGR